MLANKPPERIFQMFVGYKVLHLRNLKHVCLPVECLLLA